MALNAILIGQAIMDNQLMNIHEIKGYIQTIYLAEYSDKLLLLDGCSRPDVDIIQQYIQTILKRPLSDLKIVVVTHMHADHAGGAHYLRRLTGCKIVSLARDTQWYGGLAGFSMYTIDMLLALYVAHRQGKPLKNLLYHPYLSADYLLKDGDRVPQFSDWQVLDTYGHTDRDLSVWHEQSGQIYIADLLIRLKHKFVSPFPLYFVEHYHHSLERIQALSPSCILLAHGGKQQINDTDWQTIYRNIPSKRCTVADTIRHKFFRWF